MKFYSVLQTNSSLIEGRWQLIFTTRPGTASHIQRMFVGVDFFSVFQEVYLRTNDPRVCNIVSFSDAIGELKVEAIDEFISLNKKSEDKEPELEEGEWQMIWNSQVDFEIQTESSTN
ncbi:hypothetical protein RYX36_003340 [Vicia faba]